LPEAGSIHDGFFEQDPRVEKTANLTIPGIVILGIACGAIGGSSSVVGNNQVTGSS